MPDTDKSDGSTTVDYSHHPEDDVNFNMDDPTVAEEKTESLDVKFENLNDDGNDDQLVGILSREGDSKT